MDPVSVIQGSTPIILGQPHSGTFVPGEILEKLNKLGAQLIDTDWHVPALYDGVAGNATIVRANFSRYVIDANRDPEGQSLYPGQNTTELVPTKTFDGDPIWIAPPTQEDIAHRVRSFHRPYHDALEREISRLRAKHGVVLLYDCHSIRSNIAYLFDGELPVFNIGDNNGVTCARVITEAVHLACKKANDFTSVVNGRFRGGWTTRHYGAPEKGVHAIQMELAQRSYLQSETPPFSYDDAAASKVRNVLQRVFAGIQQAVKTIIEEE